MIEVYPNYYHKFHCIADKCMHNCCIGWEIDIDDETMEKYKSLKTEFGDKIISNIEGDPPHFILGPDEKCPFLNDEKLCDIICACGDDELCEICKLHPRFRNYYTSFIETGIGLCCEEAARIILSEKDKFEIELPENSLMTVEEQELFDVRAGMFSILQNREESIGKRLCNLADMYGISLDFQIEGLCDKYLSLERLDDKWTQVLEEIRSCNFDYGFFEEELFQLPFEQISIYFIFRHLSAAMYDRSFGCVVKFTLESCCLLAAICLHYKHKNGNIVISDMSEIARMYSSEVEYSEENMSVLLGV